MHAYELSLSAACSSPTADKLLYTMDPGTMPKYLHSKSHLMKSTEFLMFPVQYEFQLTLPWLLICLVG